MTADVYTVVEADGCRGWGIGTRVPSTYAPGLLLLGCSILLKDVDESVRMVGYDAVDIHSDESAHLVGVVDCPGVDFQPFAMRGIDESWVDDGDGTEMDGNLKRREGWRVQECQVQFAQDEEAADLGLSG